MSERCPSRLPIFQDRGVRISVAGMLARLGVFDGWDLIESTIMRGDGRYCGIALLRVQMI